MSLLQIDSQHLISVVPYTQINIPDEKEILHIVYLYANYKWMVIDRFESSHVPEVGNYTLLKFQRVFDH